MKLDYDDLCSCIRDNMLVWDGITNKDARKCDPEMVRHAIRQGNGFFYYFNFYLVNYQTVAI